MGRLRLIGLLTYYLWERALQDLIYDAEAVFLRMIAFQNKEISYEH
jgi:hypothetical protein